MAQNEILLSGTTANTTINYIDQSTQVIAPSATVSSLNDKNDNRDYTQFTVKVTSATPTETLGLTSTGQTLANQEKVTSSYSSGTLTLTSDSTETSAVWSTLLQNVTYNDSTPVPTAGNRTVTVSGAYMPNQGKNAEPVTISATDTIVIGHQNDAPTVTITSAISGLEDQVIAIKGFTISDPDAGSTKLTANLSAPAGLLSALSTGTVTVTGSNTSNLSLTGTVGNLNIYISSGGVTYVGALNANGTVNLSLAVTDDGTTGRGGAKTGNAEIPVYMAPVNDAPTVEVTSGPVSATTGVATTLSGFTFADVDAGTNKVTATIAGLSGSFTAASSANVTVGGSGTNAMTLTGSLTDINAFIAANKLSYSAAASGAMTLSIGVNDGGHTGLGDALNGFGSLALNVSAPPPPPNEGGSGEQPPVNPPVNPPVTPPSNVQGDLVPPPGGTGAAATGPQPNLGNVPANLIYQNIVGLESGSPKGAPATIALPNGQVISNELYVELRKDDALLRDLDVGRITLRQYVDAVIEFASDTSALAVQAYQFFTGLTPNRQTLNFVIDALDTGPNPNTQDLTDPFWAGKSQADRYSAFAVNLEKANPAAFTSAYGSLSFEAAARKAYDAIIGNDKAVAAGINVEQAIASILAQQNHFRELGGDDLGAKAAMAGFIMNLGVQGHVGNYYGATYNFLTDMVDGQALFGVNLVGVYSTPVTTV